MNAYCSVCGKEWDMRDPEVRYLYGDGGWECRDEAACFTRRALNELAEEA